MKLITAQELNGVLDSPREKALHVIDHALRAALVSKYKTGVGVRIYVNADELQMVEADVIAAGFRVKSNKVTSTQEMRPPNEYYVSINWNKINFEDEGEES